METCFYKIVTLQIYYRESKSCLVWRKSNLTYSMCPDKGFSSPLCSGPLLPSRRQGRKRVDRLRTAEGGAGLPGITLSGAWPEADRGCPQTLLPCLNREPRFGSPTSPRKLSKVQVLGKSQFPYLSGPSGSREISGSASQASETRERAVPEAGHAVAGISPASGLLRRAPRSASRTRTPGWGGGRRRGCLHHPGTPPGNQPEVREALRTHRSPEGARPASDVSAAPLSGAGVLEDARCHLIFSALTLSAPCVLRAHFGAPRSPFTFQLLGPCLWSLKDNCTDNAVSFRSTM